MDAAVAQSGHDDAGRELDLRLRGGQDAPGVRLAMQHATKPDHAVTVFAGQDREATEKARGYFGGHPPTSPAIAILRDGQLVYLMQRSAIETSHGSGDCAGTGARVRRVLREDNCITLRR